MQIKILENSRQSRFIFIKKGLHPSPNPPFIPLSSPELLIENRLPDKGLMQKEVKLEKIM